MYLIFFWIVIGVKSMAPNILLKMERDKRGWTQKEVADQIKAGEASYHRWESQGATPMPYYRQELSRLFGKTIEELGLLPSQSSQPSPIDSLAQKSDQIVPPFSPGFPAGTIEVSVSKPQDENGGSGLPVTEHDSSMMRQPTPLWTSQEHAWFSLSTEEIELLHVLLGGDDLVAFDASKRDALRRIAAAFLAASHTPGSFATSDPEPWERLFLAQHASSPSILLSATTLEYFEQLLTISWQLCDGNQLDAAEGVLVSFLPRILSLPSQESSTAFLASRG